MTDPQTNPPGRPRWATVLMVIGGIVLLLPGVCSVAFIAALSADGSSGLFRDSQINALWLGTFVVAAAGIALIRMAVLRR